MKRLELHLDSLRVNRPPSPVAPKSVSGELYFGMESFDFPEKGWYERVSSTLDMWLMEISSFIQKKSDICTLYFMDGPFQIKLRHHGVNGIVVDFFENFRKIHSMTLVMGLDEFHVFLQSVTVCTEHYIEGCRTMTEEIDRIEGVGRILDQVRIIEKYLEDITDMP